MGAPYAYKINEILPLYNVSHLFMMLKYNNIVSGSISALLQQVLKNRCIKIIISL